MKTNLSIKDKYTVVILQTRQNQPKYLLFYTLIQYIGFYLFIFIIWLICKQNAS